jgi:hypothetical protein
MNTGEQEHPATAGAGHDVAAGHEGLKSRPTPVEDRRLSDAQRKIGELAMDLDIAKALLEEVERRPGSPRR